MGGEVPVIVGVLPVSIPEGLVHTVVTLSDEILSNSAINKTVQVRVTLTPAVIMLTGSLVIPTETGSGTGR